MPPLESLPASLIVNRTCGIVTSTTVRPTESREGRQHTLNAFPNIRHYVNRYTVILSYRCYLPNPVHICRRQCMGTQSKAIVNLTRGVYFLQYRSIGATHRVESFTSSGAGRSALPSYSTMRPHGQTTWRRSGCKNYTHLESRLSNRPPQMQCRDFILGIGLRHMPSRRKGVLQLFK